MRPASHQRCRAPREQDRHDTAVLSARSPLGCGPSFFPMRILRAGWFGIQSSPLARRSERHRAPTPCPHAPSYETLSMWFKNLRIYRLAPSWDLTPESLEAALERLTFRPGSATDMTAFGWTPPRPESGLVHALDGQYLLNLRVEKKLLPSTVVNQFARARAQEIEEQQGYKPGRKQMKEIKEQVTDELLPKAFSIYRDTRVWIDTRGRWLVVDAAAAAKCDEVMG